MLSKRSFCNYFSVGIWKKQTLRFWPIWTSYLVIWLLTAPQMLDSYYYFEDAQGLDGATFLFGRSLIQSLNSCSIVIGIYAPIVAAALYGYLYQNRSINLFHALPVRRDTMFVTNFVTGISFLVVPNLVLTGYFGVLQVIHGATQDIVPLLTWFAVTTLMVVFFFGAATLCAMATATRLMLPVLYVILNFAVVSAESLLRWLASMFLWGISDSTMLYQKWSPMTYIMGQGFANNRQECIQYRGNGTVIESYVRFQDWGYVLLLALTGLAFAGVALWLYRRWQSESAGDLIAFSCLRPVFTYGWAAGCSLALGSVLYLLLGEGSILGVLFAETNARYGYPSMAETVGFVLCMLIGGTVGYFSAKMLQKKSFRVFSKRDWRGYGAFVLALLTLVLCIKADIFGIENWTPDAEDVEAVWVAGDKVMPVGNADTQENIQQVIRIHETILEQRVTLQEQLRQQVDYQNSYIQNLRLRYQLKSGRQVIREYYVRVDKDLIRDIRTPVGMLYAFTESKEQRLERSGLKDFGKITDAKLYVYHTPKDPQVYEEVTFYVDKEVPGEMDSLLSALHKDIEEGGIGAGMLFERLFAGDKYPQTSKVWGELSIFSDTGKQVQFHIDEQNPNTQAWVEEVLQAYLAKQTQSKPSQNDVIAGVNP